jgi:hypothetical protein
MDLSSATRRHIVDRPQAMARLWSGDPKALERALSRL